jgi:hypothetical protein
VRISWYGTSRFSIILCVSIIGKEKYKEMILDAAELPEDMSQFVAKRCD